LGKPFKVVNNADTGDADHYGGNDIDNMAGWLNAQSDYHTYDYYIYKISTTYYAKNGTTGIVDYSDTSFFTVISSVITALSSGGLIQLGRGDFSLTSRLTITQNNIKIRGLGVDITRILYDLASTTTAGFKVTGSIGSDKVLTANSARGIYTLAVNSGHGIVAEDWVYLARNVSIDSNASTMYDAEIHQVASVTSTQLTLKEKIHADYNTSASARANKITWVTNFQLQDLTMYENRSSNTDVTEQCDTLFLFNYGLRISNVKFERMFFCSCGLQNCYDTIVDKPTFEHPQFLVSGGINYGLKAISATTNLTVNQITGNHCRHTFTTGSNTGSQSTTYGPGRQRNIVINGGISRNSNCADFDCHEGCNSIVFNGCGAISGDPDAGLQTNVGGFNTRSPAIFNGCWTEGAYGYCMNIFSKSTPVAGTEDAPGGDRTQVIGCKFSRPQLEASADQDGIRIEGNRSSVLISDCLFYNIEDKAIQIGDQCSHITITGNIFDTCGGDNSSSEGIIHCLGYCSDLTVANNDFSAGTAPANSRPVYFVTGVDRFTFVNNNVQALTNTSPTVPAGSGFVKLRDNSGLNAIGKVTNFVDSTNHIIAFFGGNTNAVIASTDYLIEGTDVVLTSTGGTGVSITIKDFAGNTVASSLTTLTAVHFPNGFQINFGGFSVAPTVTMFAE